MERTSATMIGDFDTTSYLATPTNSASTQGRLSNAINRTNEHGLVLTLEHQIPLMPSSSAARSAHLGLKRFVDVVLSASALLAMSLVLLTTAVAIKLTSPGPVFFRQWRPGLNGVMFPMLKFRTMHTHMGDSSGIKQTVANDPRVTTIGAFLRRTSVDELPQLLNVLLGQMSLVGPRPHPANMLAGGMDYRELVPYYELRYAMRPGLSGWAQAHGLRGPTEDAVAAKSRIAHDMAYIQNFNVLLDLKIIVRTLVREFVSGSGL